jgi:hypothetical protein
MPRPASSVIVTSPDGVVWTARASGTDQGVLYGAAWSGTQFAAVGGDRDTSPLLFTSADGVTWTIQDTGPEQAILYGVTWTGTNFVAVGGQPKDSWDGQIGLALLSVDGITWAPTPLDTTNGLYGVIWNGTQAMAVGSDGTILSSP